MTSEKDGYSQNDWNEECMVEEFLYCVSAWCISDMKNDFAFNKYIDTEYKASRNLINYATKINYVT